MIALKGRAGPAPGVWWLTPAGAIVLLVPATLAAAVWFDDSHFRSSWQTPKVLTGSTVTLYVVGLAIFMIGSLLPLLLRTRAAPQASWAVLSDHEQQRVRSASNVVFWLTIFGYAALGVVGVARGARPVDVVRAVTQQDIFGSPLRTYFAPVTGITTLTQLGIAYVVLSVLLVLQGRADRQTFRRVILIMVLAVARTYFLSERLATIELIMPIVTLVAVAVRRDGRASTVRFVRLAPLILVPALIAGFSALEYTRSWVFYASRSDSFASFAFDRLVGYYVTAYNNGQLAITAAASYPRLPYQSIEAFWTAPGVPPDLYQHLTGQPAAQNFSTVLAQSGNPEFNSIGGLAVPFVDYGIAGGLIFLLLVGALIGLVYREFCSGTSWALLLYPVLVTGLFEMPRYLYWGQGRVAPAAAALLITSWWVMRGSDSARRPLVRSRSSVT